MEISFLMILYAYILFNIPLQNLIIFLELILMVIHYSFFYVRLTLWGHKVA
jgi:hypothetical protein